MRRVWIPAVLAVGLAFVPDHRPDPCASSDGPQFRCALERDARLLDHG